MTDKLTDTEINKICARVMGIECWHIRDLEKDISWFTHKCSVCKEAFSYKDNPDPLNSPADWAALVFYVVNEWEDKEREDFILSVQQDEPEYNEYSFPRHLLKNKRALPTAVAAWCKEGKDE
ncbi:hypothetical protein KAR91_31705 [Candidatus Pacearchaeota archaeon]|nr:hypothetical protein [Candidatus Pacearchaeota archaeon]